MRPVVGAGDAHAEMLTQCARQLMGACLCLIVTLLVSHWVALVGLVGAQPVPGRQRPGGAVLCCAVLRWGLRFLPRLPHFEECSHQQQPWWFVHVPAAGAESAFTLEVEL